MDYRDRNSSPYDRDEGRLAGRDEPRWQDQSNRGSRDWDRGARDWDRQSDDSWRSQDRDFRQHNDFRDQHNDLRSQGRGFRERPYGDTRQDYDRQLSQRDQSYREGAYSGPTGSYSGYRDNRSDWSHSHGQGVAQQDWGRDSSRAGFYYGGASTQRDAWQQQQNSARSFATPSYGGRGASSFSTQGDQYGTGARYGARSYEVQGSRGEYGGGQEESFGQQLRDAGQHMIRSVKRVFRGPKGYKRSDERIREDVNDRLAQQDQVDPSEIEVQVQNGEVTLTGTVQSRHEKFLAEEIADDVSGVTDVHNQLRLQRDNAQSTTSSNASSQYENTTRVRNGHA